MKGWWLTLLLAPTFAQSPPVTLASPSGTLSVSVRVDGEGRPEYAVRRGAATIVDWSRLGFILAEQPKLERNFAVTGSAQRALDETWEQPWGERRFVPSHCRELRVGFTEKNAGRTLDVVFRVFDDGVGFRYEFPRQASLATVNIVEELTEFAIGEGGTAWWIPGGE